MQGTNTNPPDPLSLRGKKIKIVLSDKVLWSLRGVLLKSSNQISDTKQMNPFIYAPLETRRIGPNIRTVEAYRRPSHVTLMYRFKKERIDCACEYTC